MLGDRSRRGAALSTASTVVVLAGLAAIILLGLTGLLRTLALQRARLN